MRTVLMAGVMALGWMATAQASIISYSETFSNGSVAQGTFNATVSGNAITNISNPTLSIGNIVYTRPLFVEHWNGSKFVDGGAYASFDNSNNNFMFIDSNYAANDFSDSGYLFSVPGFSDQIYSANKTTIATGHAVIFTDLSSNIAVPEPASLALLVVGLVGAGALRRVRSI